MKITKPSLILFIFLATSFSSLFADERRPITIGSKLFSESYILAEMIAVILEEKYDLKVDRKISLGGTKINFEALNGRSIDIYPDYTGTGYVMILKRKDIGTPEEVYKKVSTIFKNDYGIIWSKPLGFNNTYALAIRSDDPRLSVFNKISEISPISNQFRIAAAYEFMEREDGYQNFAKTYELKFKPINIKSVEAGLMYNAIKSQEVDFIVAYSTDGRIKANNLKLLEDDRRFFPPYSAAYLTTKEAIEEFPEILEAFKILEGTIDENTMAALNYEVDELKRDSRIVATNFLIRRGIISGEETSSKDQKSFLGFMKAKKTYFQKILGEHILLTLVALFIAIIIAIPLGIAMTRYKFLAKTLFPIVNTVQTIPSLALLGFLVPFLGIGFTPAVFALFLYSLLPLVRNTYEGIKGVDRKFVEVSRGIGLTPLQILVKVEIPLALPIILAGLRTAAVIVVGTATLAALVGAGGLGDPIFRGVATVNSNLIFLGAIPSAVLAIIMDKLIGFIESYFVSPGLKLMSKR